MKNELINLIVEERYHIGVLAGIVVQVTAEMCNAHFKSVWAEIIPTVVVLLVFNFGVEIARRKSHEKQ